jgi:hypothetical protein
LFLNIQLESGITRSILNQFQKFKKLLITANTEQSNYYINKLIKLNAKLLGNIKLVACIQFNNSSYYCKILKIKNDLQMGDRNKAYINLI